MRFALLLSAFIFQLTSIAQMEFRNKSIKDPILKVVYAGVDNHINLSIPLKKEQSLQSSSSKITTIDNQNFLLLPNYHTTFDTIRIMSGDEVIMEEYFRILKMPLASIQLGEIDLETKYVSITQILNNQTLLAIENGLYLETFEINNFKLSIYSIDNELIKEFETTNGTSLTSDQMDYIKQLEPGQIIEFSSVKFTDSKGIMRRHMGPKFIIK
ncbi:GldM family protein [Crocinitomix algicola]|uniref:GldM family protein n=1 Tax=Crocinitomix algicola TaxID=1740263 RepID=UPI001586E722|nr:GldM family protein [Crocinitomix algicola]